MAWNEPLAASFLGENVPKEHLMYVLEIDPPVDKNDDNSGVTLMPACNVSSKVEKIKEDSLDSISSPSTSLKIQIIDRKVYLR